MALRAVLSSLEGISDELKKEYKEKNGKFFLDVSEADGFALEDVKGLKASLSKEREAVREHKDKLKAFEELDIDAARAALAKVEEWTKAPPEKKLAEQIKLMEEQLNNKHKKELETHATSIRDLTLQLEDELISSRGTTAIAAKKGSVELLLPIISKMTKTRKGANGRLEAIVVDDHGNPRISGKSGSTDPMSINELVDELSQKDTYARAFDGAGARGTGAGAGEGNGTRSSKPFTITADEAKNPQNYQRVKAEAAKAGVEMQIIY